MAWCLIFAASFTCHSPKESTHVCSYGCRIHASDRGPPFWKTERRPQNGSTDSHAIIPPLSLPVLITAHCPSVRPSRLVSVRILIRPPVA